MLTSGVYLSGLVAKALKKKTGPKLCTSKVTTMVRSSPLGRKFMMSKIMDTSVLLNHVDVSISYKQTKYFLRVPNFWDTPNCQQKWFSQLPVLKNCFMLSSSMSSATWKRPIKKASRCRTNTWVISHLDLDVPLFLLGHMDKQVLEMSPTKYSEIGPSSTWIRVLLQTGSLHCVNNLKFPETLSQSLCKSSQGT